LTWKQLFFENYVQQGLEGDRDIKESSSTVLNMIETCQEYIFSLKVSQPQKHSPMSSLAPKGETATKSS
jgi:hypothetical protein